jgi:hypothetical protein
MERKNAIAFWWGETCAKCLLGRQRRKWENKISVDFGISDLEPSCSDNCIVGLLLFTLQHFIPMLVSKLPNPYYECSI